MIWQRPDWLSEERGQDVSTRTRWFPVISFFQLLVDQPFGNSLSGGHGHNYAPDVVESWAVVTRNDDWDSQKRASLQQLINSHYSSVE